MSGVFETLVLAFLIIPVILLIVGMISLPVLFATLFIKYKMLHHH